MRNLLFIIAAIALTACNTPASETSSEKGTDQSKEMMADNQEGQNVYGDSTVTDHGAIKPNVLMAKMEDRDSVSAKLTATINETCKKKGCWMTLDMENGEEMRVGFKDYSFFVPTEGQHGKTAIVDGYAYTDTVSVADLQHIAQDAGKSDDEIAAIKEPEIAVNFEATGVIIRD